MQLINCHHLHPHAYADDTQIYGFCNPLDADLLQERMSVCVDEVSLCMTSNRLLLNLAKTEVGLLWYYGALLLDVSVRSRLNQYVSATRQCFRCLLSGTSGSILLLISLRAPMSLQPLGPASQHSGGYEACGVPSHVMLC